MADVDAALAANRHAADDLLAACERCSAVWTVPRAPGKWSPAQIVEHVARAFEESAHSVDGTPSKFPKLPGIVRPLARGLLFNRVLKNDAFPKAKATSAFNPASGPETPAAARTRLDEAVRKFEQACRARAATSETFGSMIFGRLLVADYIRFQEIHTRHHRKQLQGS